MKEDQRKKGDKGEEKREGKMKGWRRRRRGRGEVARVK